MDWLCISCYNPVESVEVPCKCGGHRFVKGDIQIDDGVKCSKCGCETFSSHEKSNVFSTIVLEQLHCVDCFAKSEMLTIV